MINAASYMPLTHDPIISVLGATLILIREPTPTPCSPPLPKCSFNPFGSSSCPLAYLSLSDLWGCPCSWGHWQLQQVLTGRGFCRTFSHAETETEEEGCRGEGPFPLHPVGAALTVTLAVLTWLRSTYSSPTPSGGNAGRNSAAGVSNKKLRILVLGPEGLHGLFSILLYKFAPGK